MASDLAIASSAFESSDRELPVDHRIDVTVLSIEERCKTLHSCDVPVL